MIRVMAVALIGLLGCAGCGGSSSSQPAASGGTTVPQAKAPETQQSGTVSTPAATPAGDSSKNNPSSNGGTASNESTEPVKVGATNHTIVVPQGWKVETPSSSMRLMQLRIPKAPGDSEDGELTLSKAGGGLESNLNRWAGQFGGDQALKATRKLRTAGDIEATLVELEGTYTAMTMQGTQPPKDGYKMLGAVIIAPDGEYYFKFPGQAKTVDAHREAFDRLVASFK